MSTCTEIASQRSRVNLVEPHPLRMSFRGHPARPPGGRIPTCGARGIPEILLEGEKSGREPRARRLIAIRFATGIPRGVPRSSLGMPLGMTRPLSSAPYHPFDVGEQG